MIGCTPGEWGDEETFDTRGQEIQRWLEDNAVEPYRFVIIDDFSTIEAASGQEDFWITVNPHCGISKKDLLAPFTSPAESVSTKFLAPPFS